MKRFVLFLALSLACMPRAMALRPFDGTDAAVAQKGTLEFEFGYLGLLREEQQTFLLSPALVANAGLAAGTELVVEGRLRSPVAGRSGTPRSSLEDVAVSVKHVFVDGVLQDVPGPSVASECGLLLPAAAGERAGLVCSGIVSQRVLRTTLHINGTLARTREHEWARSIGVIVAGPHYGKVEPVLEAVVGAAPHGARMRSALAGVIVELADKLNLDFGIRIASEKGTRIAEARAGLTWSPR